MTEGQLYFKAAIMFEKMTERTERPAVIVNPRSASESVLVSVTGGSRGRASCQFCYECGTRGCGGKARGLMEERIRIGR